jgi:uncharacterized protein (DUF427 family)
VELGGVVIAETRRAKRVLETSHPPTYYIPAEDVRTDLLRPLPGDPGSFCEWKGRARYSHVVLPSGGARRACWCYPKPTRAFAAIRDHFAFYAALMDRCLVNGKLARPQPGGFYGGWITEDVVGPFKGEPGTRGW